MHVQQAAAQAAARADEQVAAQRCVEGMQADLTSIAQLDVHRPFDSLEDAVDRLLPMHALAAQDPDTVILAEELGEGEEGGSSEAAAAATAAAAAAGASEPQLACSRDAAWRGPAAAKAADSWRHVQQLQGQVQEVERREREQAGTITAIDRFGWDRLLTDRAKLLHAEERARVGPIQAATGGGMGMGMAGGRPPASAVTAAGMAQAASLQLMQSGRGGSMGGAPPGSMHQAGGGAGAAPGASAAPGAINLQAQLQATLQASMSMGQQPYRLAMPAGQPMQLGHPAVVTTQVTPQQQQQQQQQQQRRPGQ